MKLEFRYHSGAPPNCKPPVSPCQSVTTATLMSRTSTPEIRLPSNARTECDVPRLSTTMPYPETFRPSDHCVAWSEDRDTQNRSGGAVPARHWHSASDGAVFVLIHGPYLRDIYWHAAKRHGLGRRHMRQRLDPR